MQMTQIKVIGIVGGGQLGRMLTQSAKRQGYTVIILDPQKNCPASQVCDEHIMAPFDDANALQKLGELSDVVTFEFENIDSDKLNRCIPNSKLPQQTHLLRLTQHRIREKESLNALGIRTVDWRAVTTVEELQQAVAEIGYPCVLKTTRFGYDGKGQVVLKNTADIAQATQLLNEQACILEEWLTFEKEVSVMVSRNPQGECSFFPVAENVHVNNILHTSMVPARLSKQTTEQVRRYTEKIANAFQLVGTLGIEYFVTAEGEVFVNELAPRPHNSGHYSIEACNFSQFDTSIQAVCGLPMPNIHLLSSVVMVNVLGQHLSLMRQLRCKQAMWHFHDYGKNEAKHNRKMGHMTILTDNCEEVLAHIEQLYAPYQ